MGFTVIQVTEMVEKHKTMCPQFILSARPNARQRLTKPPTTGLVVFGKLLVRGGKHALVIPNTANFSAQSRSFQQPHDTSQLGVR